MAPALINTRTWNNTEWPGLVLVQPEKPKGNKKDYSTLGGAFDLIMLAEFEFPASHESQAWPRRGDSVMCCSEAAVACRNTLRHAGGCTTGLG